MKCDNVDTGCDWEGTVGTLEEHLAVCEFAPLPCPKLCKDDNDMTRQFLRKELEEHLAQVCPNREHVCDYCGLKGTYIHITRVHDEVCESKIVACPNECDETMMRSCIEDHINNECENTIVSCKYKRIGCNTSLKRSDMAAHENDDNYHLHMAIETTAKLELTLEESSERTTQLETNLKETLDRTVKLEKDLVDKISKVEEKISSQIVAAGLGVQDKDDSITLKSGEPMKFRMTGFEELKEQDEVVTSPSFYIFPNGYRVGMKVYVNGYGPGKDSHVSLHLCILPGKYDAQLKWPLVAKLCVSLLNQEDDDDHKVMSFKVNARKNIRVGGVWTFNKLCSHSNLCDIWSSTRYLQDDTLYFQASVTLADQKPWLE